MSYLNDYLLEAQIEDAYETGFLDALEKVAAKEDNDHLRAAGMGAGLGLAGLGAHGAYGKYSDAKKRFISSNLGMAPTNADKLQIAKNLLREGKNSALSHMGQHKAKYALGLGAATGLGLKRGYDAMTEKKAAYEEYILDKIAADAATTTAAPAADAKKTLWEKTKGYGKSAYDHVGRNKLKYGVGAGALALGGGAYAYKKHQEKKAAFEAALAYLEDYDY